MADHYHRHDEQQGSSRGDPEEKDQSSSASLRPASDPAIDRNPSKSRRGKRNIIVSAVLMVLILGLALGLGLGLGLKKKRKDNDPTASSDTTNLAFIPREKLVDLSQLTLSSSFDINAPPQDRHFNWTLSEVYASPAGVRKKMRVVNGISPGPLVEANLGDRIIVQVHNNMSVPTSIHWHGQFQRGSNYMDGSVSINECGIPSGGSVTYNWTVQQSGTFWWHSHFSATYSDGIFGPLILHAPNDTYGFSGSNSSAISERQSLSDKDLSTRSPATSNTTYNGDLIFVVGDVYHEQSETVMASYFSVDGPDGTQGDEPTPDAGLVNGLGRSDCAFAPDGASCDSGGSFNFTVEPNKRYRLRVINTGSLAGVVFSVDGHKMTVIEADSTLIEPVIVNSLMVEVAQRYSVIIETDQAPAAYYLRGELSSDMFAYDNPGLVTAQTAVMRYSNSPVGAYSSLSTLEPSYDVSSPPSIQNVTQALDVDSLVPLFKEDPPDSTRTETLFVTFGLDSQSNWRAFFNYTSFASERPDGMSTTNTSTLLKSIDTYEISQKPYSTSEQLLITSVGQDADESKPEVIDLIINNQDDGDHPFHLHGYTPYLLGTGKGNFVPTTSNSSSTGAFGTVSQNLHMRFDNPMRRDTFVIPAFSWGAVRFVADNPGVWPMHCHLVSHMAAGLLMQFQVLPSQISSMAKEIPQDFKNACGST
ncbi:hypothetical protein IE53DRAFT_316599 [Violaceomyces palustris]|uniref:Uncharacterized protein n=1 Tax=Violaceomyces palustris TaxID=1673888 RepID=A0ACD0NW79_9BASI|nr:hypothetical protein IE53DRAFT_316599 [Violaceomyces palustris]